MAAQDCPPCGRLELTRGQQAPGQPWLSLNERGGEKKIKTLRYMNCEIKSKYSNKESHNNISKDVYQGLKLNTDFFINPNTKRNKVLWNVKYNLQGKKNVPCCHKASCAVSLSRDLSREQKETCPCSGFPRPKRS